MRLDELNTLEESEAQDRFLLCCGSTGWAGRMAAARPYPTEAALFDHADHTWSDLPVDDWLEAFSKHPRIGDTTGSRWSRQEQSGTQTAAPATLEALAEGNREYWDRFGFVFLICATGRSAAEMLSSLRERLPNDRETEIHNAAGQQRLITRLRLEKLLHQ